MNHLKAAFNNPVVWEDFEAEIDKKLDRALKELSTKEKIVEVYRLQGIVESLRDMKRMRTKLNERDKESNENGLQRRGSRRSGKR